MNGQVSFVAYFWTALWLTTSSGFPLDYHHFHRMLELDLSENCTASNEAIGEHPTIAAATDEQQAQLAGINMTDLCTNVNDPNTKAVCNLDLASYLPVDFSSTCQAVGGELIASSVAVDCEEFSWALNSGFCISDECSDDDKTNIAEAANQVVADEFSIALDDSGLTCTSTAYIDGEANQATVSGGGSIFHSQVYTTTVMFAAMMMASAALVLLQQ